MSSDDKLRCPSCGGADVRHSLPRGFLDAIMLSFGKSPFRCRRCERRFYCPTAKRATGPETPPTDREA